MKLILDNGEEFEVEKIKTLELQENDQIIIETNTILSSEQNAHLRSSLKKTFGEQRKIILLDGGLELGILREKT